MNQSVYLIRHAESAMNVQPHLIGGRSNEAELTTEGVLQAKRLGHYLLENHIEPTLLYCSPARRTVDTAGNALRIMGIAPNIVLDDRLQELDQGTYVGRDRTTVYTPSVLARIDDEGKGFKLPEGESMNEVGERMKEWLESIPDTSDVTLVFTHGVAIRCLVSTLENWSHAHTYKSHIPNVSITRIHKSDGEWHLDFLGKEPT